MLFVTELILGSNSLTFGRKINNVNDTFTLLSCVPEWSLYAMYCKTVIVWAVSNNMIPADVLFSRHDYSHP